MRTRALLLVMTIGIAVGAVACGRASESDINSALGITPSPTKSAEEFATGTAQAAAAATAAGSPGAVAQGDIRQGQTQFNTWCQQCHRPDGSGRGPTLAGADSPAAGMSDDQLTDLVRNGTNHDPPGGYETFEISDRNVNNIIAYLRSIAQ